LTRLSDMSDKYRISKRFFDIFAAFAGLIVLSPLFLVLSFLILLNDGFPVFFRQRRIGRDGVPFVLLKFRTMVQKTGSEKGLFEPGATQRVTLTGKFLRKHKLDELPQLLNVLIGDMSIVGPRPEVERYVQYYPEKWAGVHKVRPGITDKASIMFRNEEEILSGSADPDVDYITKILPVKLDLNLEYITTCSFSGDLKIIFSTLKHISPHE
jgi:lipopolysaccharide/colanic/teichoic acid biosynthesis glycosyltransferase